MNSDRIKEIQESTAYPDSVSVKQALLQVWNECSQESNLPAIIKEIEGLIDTTELEEWNQAIQTVLTILRKYQQPKKSSMGCDICGANEYHGHNSENIDKSSDV